MGYLPNIPLFIQIKKPLLRLYYQFLDRKELFVKTHCPKQYADILFERTFGRKIDWEHPRDLNEVINYLEFCTDTKEWSRLSDKILVRDYVKEKGLEDILVPLLGVWDDANNIDFDALPQKFVLKCNHDSGSAHIIDKEKGYDREKIVSELNQCLGRKFGDLYNEPHYNRIVPKVLAEEFIDLDNHEEISSSPIDYKVFCLNGEPDVIWTAYNRSKVYVNHDTYDIDWNYKPEYGADDVYYRLGKGIISKPKSLERMISAARILSRGFPQVRVDFYDVEGKLYFGEMTFTSDCGRMPFFSERYQKLAGAKIDLAKVKKF